MAISPSTAVNDPSMCQRSLTPTQANLPMHMSLAQGTAATVVNSCQSSPKRSVRNEDYARVYKGEILPSDQAYADLILDRGASLLQTLGWEDLVEVETKTKKIRNHDNNNKGLTIVTLHSVKYKNETIWRFQTKSVYSAHGTSGQSASCTYMKSKGVVRVKILHKARNCLAKGSHHTEMRNYDIFSMLAKSGQARQSEVMLLQ